ncbi:phage protein [Staphylococcus petrasii]|uniref:DUF1381 domain-containing protein n=1 Tax=Staphylococcus petrasii TaxID=1276936 RepID=A0A380G2R0_9STAP|nr:DUF1381 domain-containing protein [Staphylococcus petrasii]PNZ31283.1 hypothetical protein CD137_03225 [Staphylococcus petrasii]TGE11724.1 DUF1381 domain-containing protein [Staphylococcus petrasii]TGE15112.1 DUF1381 domain-containing protein [Staphylococcus petrasii]SUM44620.1 phage protein [Staphylococcus petrasii]
MQYLIRQFKDSTGHIHTNVQKARENETFSVIEADSKEAALNKYNTLTGIDKLQQLLLDKRIPHEIDMDIETHVISIGKIEVVINDKYFKVFEYQDELSFEPEQLVLTTTDIDEVINYLFGE